MDALAKRIISQISTFTDFLANNNVKGFIGEVGWPNEPHAGATDAALWNAAAEHWVTKADDAEAWITFWSAWLLNVYELSIYGNEVGGPSGDLETVHTQAAVIEAHPPQDGWTNVRRGVNFAGPEFAHDPVSNNFSNNDPGTAGTDYFFPNQTQFENLAARSVTVVRLPFRWERIQPTLGAALDNGELTRLTDCIAAAGDAGLKVILDCHNYARYHYWTGSLIRTLKLRREAGIDTTAYADGEGRFGAEYLVDLWERLSAAFANNATVIGYDLQNEPHDLDAEEAEFSGTTRYNWEDGVQSWAGEGSTTAAHETTTVRTGTGALSVSRTGLTVGAYANLRANDGGALRLGAVSGNTLELWVQLASGTAGTWQARPEWQNQSFQWQAGGWTTLTAGQWVKVSHTYTGGITDPRAFGLQIESNSPQATSVTAYADDYGQGSAIGGLSAAGVGESITQDVVDAVAATGDDTDLIVPGYGWNVLSWPHTTAWITTPSGYTGTIRYATHHYFDPDGSGNYGSGETYADTLAAAVSAGFTSDADTTAPTISGGPTPGNLTPTGVTISWTLSGDGDGRVLLRRTSSDATWTRSSARVTTQQTSHAIAFSGLAQGTGYTYEVRSRDAAGNLATATGTFTTSAASSTPPPAPEPAQGVPSVQCLLALATKPTETPVWEDVTDFLQEFTITRGRQTELDRVQAETATVLLDSRVRTFDPTYAAGPYYGQLKAMRRLFLRAGWGGAEYDLFSGYVEGWPQEWAPHDDATVTLRATDGFLVLGMATLNASLPAQQSGARINAVLDAVAWQTGTGWVLGVGRLDIDATLGPVGDRNVATGDSALQASTLAGVNALAHVQQVEETEAGLLFVSKSGAVTFHNRRRRFGAPTVTPLVAFGQEPGDLPPALPPVVEHGAAHIRNEIRVTREGGATQTAQDTDSQADYFRRTHARSVLLMSDSEALSAAQYLLSRYKDPPPRVTSLVIDGHHPSGLVWPHFLGRELGDCVLVRHQPPGGGDPIEQVSFLEAITGLSWRAPTDGDVEGWQPVTWALSPADTTSWWRLNESALDTGTTLAW